MNDSVLDIHGTVDREVAENNLHPLCALEAEQESRGNEHLKIAMYVIKRVAMLEKEASELAKEIESPIEQPVERLTPKDVEFERRREQSMVPLVRYHCNTAKNKDVNPQVKRKRRKVCLAMMGNTALVIGVLGALLSKWILGGGTLFNLSYVWIAAVLSVALLVPILFTKLKIGSFRMSYANALFLSCVLSAAVSTRFGIKLLKTDPSTYSEMASEPEKPSKNEDNRQYVSSDDSNF